MRCKDIEELILTDYSDNELTGERKQMVEAHLTSCPQCRQLAERLKSANEVLVSSKIPALDQERIWQRITDQIEAEKEKSVIYEPVQACPSFWPRVLRPAYVLTTVAIIVLVMMIYFQREHDKIAQLKEKEEIQDVAYVLDEYSSAAAEDNDDLAYEYGTAIEEYFL